MGSVLKPTDDLVDKLKKLVPVEVITLSSTVAAFFALFESLTFAQIMIFIVMGVGAIMSWFIENRRWNAYVKRKAGRYKKQIGPIILTMINGVVWIFLVNLRFFQEEGGLFVLTNDWNIAMFIVVFILLAFSGLYKGWDQP